MESKIKKRRKFLFKAILFIGIIIFFYLQNNLIEISELTIANNAVPHSFKDYKILHISDLHNKSFGIKQQKIIRKIEQIHPDIIVITGDLIDSGKPDTDAAMELIAQAVTIAPIYYVSGNHEAWSGSYNNLKSDLINCGVTVLDNECTEVLKDTDSIHIIGLSDPSFGQNNWMEKTDDDQSQTLLHTLANRCPDFTILLSHRPDLFDIYSTADVDLIFSGHAHGGQFRFPFIGGIFAPDQGIFPDLTEGIHTKNHSSMIISRGLGNSVIPLRLFNRPELVVVTLSD